jgi:hypothetical protein
MKMSLHGTDIAAGAVAGLFTLAQVDVPGAGLLEMLIKAGASGIVGAVCIVLIRENRKQNQASEDSHKEAVRLIEASHKEASEKFDKGMDRLCASVDRQAVSMEKMVAHCAAKNG